ncbi:MAG: glycosyltransferase [Verrucomicrobia bacterium]|nr:glycosyltransferase [Verrucomicrobiota bacterium]
MRVLITNNSLAEHAGTELYVRDVAFALRRRGHDPIAYSSRLGAVAEELVAGGVPVLDDLSMLEMPPDLIHAHHHMDAMVAMLRFPRVPAVLFCHGSMPWEEAPVFFPSILHFVAIDDACHDRLTSAGVAPDAITTLRTFVDLHRFPLREQCAPEPRRALVFSNYAAPGPGLELIRVACAEAGITEVDVIGHGMGTAVAHPEEILQRYDVVFAKGRAAHEAAATGAAVIVSDYSRFAGLLTSDVYEVWRSLNFGVRTLVYSLEQSALVAEIRRYQASDVRRVTERLRREADLETSMDRLMGLYERIHSGRDRLALLSEGVFTAAASVYLQGLADQLKSPDALALRIREEMSALPNPLLTDVLMKASMSRLEDKIRRLTTSFSWRVTAPLRLLRRRLVDPFRPEGPRGD